MEKKREAMQKILIFILGFTAVTSWAQKPVAPVKALVTAPKPDLNAVPLWGEQAATMIGEIYNLEGTERLFTYARYGDFKHGDSVLRNAFYDLKGDLVALETSHYKSGKLLSYSVDQIQRKKQAKIEVRGTKVLFSLTDEKGVTKKEEETLAENFIVGMTLIPHLLKNWKTLMGGDSIKVRFGVWSRLETVGFKFWKDDDKGDTVVIVMKPTSFMIRALVDPLYFTFNKISRALVQIKGRTTPNIMKKGKWKELDALIKYLPGPGAKKNK